MTIASMTGFARIGGSTKVGRFNWEIKAVNARGLDVRLRLAPGFDPIEPDVRTRISSLLARGTVQANLTVQRDAVTPEVAVNLGLLRKLVDALAGLDLKGAIAPATLDGLLAQRGVVEIREAEEDEAAIVQARREALDGLEAALSSLVAMRRGEGAVLAAILAAKLDRISRLALAAEQSPARSAEAIQGRLTQSLALLFADKGLDATRLHQEAALLAVKADIREELDRLMAHVAAASDLLAKGEAAGRRLDFLAQELGREANTLCAKSNDPSLTAIGIELRVEIEQFREQVQNIE